MSTKAINSAPKRERRKEARPGELLDAALDLFVENCTNIIENIMGSVRRVCRNVKRWRDASMALRWTAAAMLEAAKGCRRLKAQSQLPQLRAALLAHQQKRDPAVSVAQPQQAA
jgi:hypothetical protein